MNPELIAKLSEFVNIHGIQPIVYNLSFVAGNEGERLEEKNLKELAEKWFGIERILETASRHIAQKD